MFKVLLPYIVLCSFYGINGKPVVTIDNAGVDLDSNNLGFLVERGYLTRRNTGGEQIKSQKEVEVALKKFQGFVGVPRTGKLDALTADFMVKPRCGMPDNLNVNGRRQKRYTLQGSSWINTNLTWALENSNNDGLSDYKIRRLLSAAFADWQAETNVRFTELVNEPDNSAVIRVRFEEGYHGDPYTFDGRGGRLAHSFFPLNNKGLTGDIHFEDAEEFTDSLKPKKNQTSFQWVALHQIGHALGLDHSSERGAIMFPYFERASMKGDPIHLDIDDIFGIQAIYGEKVTPE